MVFYINKLDLSDRSVDRCNLAFLRRQNQSPRGESGISSGNC